MPKANDGGGPLEVFPESRVRQNDVGSILKTTRYCTGGRSFMKKICGIVVVLLLILSSMAYADQFGPPEPQVREGQLALGIGYFYADEKLKPSDDSYLGTPGFWQKASFTQNQAYLQASFGILKDWEIFGRLGGADMRVKDAFDFKTSMDDAKDNLRVYGTFGFKGVLYRNPRFVLGPLSTFTMGPVFKSSIYSNYNDSASGTIGGTAITSTYNVKEMWDANLAWSMQTKLSSLTFFAGPFVYWKHAKASLDVIITGTGAFSDSTKYESDNWVGGFAGVRVPLTKHLSLEVEGQYTNKASAGAVVMYSF
jgi:hypothetical protein